MVAAGMTDEMCSAVVTDPPHHLHPRSCSKRATQDVAGVKVCGVHARMARKWDSENRLQTMIEHWWKKP